MGRTSGARWAVGRESGEPERRARPARQLTRGLPLRALKRSDGEDEHRLETESGNDDEEDDGWQSFNPKKKEELKKRYRKSLEAKRGWRMGQKGQQFVDLDD